MHIVGLNAGGGFAGHTDWRVPNIMEIQTIVNHENVQPAVSSAFNTGCVAACTVLTCSCTAVGTSPYWSSTTYVPSPAYSWYLSFYDTGKGLGDNSLSGNLNFVRAVRGGL